MAKGDRIVSLVTGPILGLDAQPLLAASTAFAAELGKELAVFDLFDELAAQDDRDISDGINRFLYIRSLLEGYDYQFDLKRRNAYCTIARKIDALAPDVNVIVRTPATIEFRGVTVQFKDQRTIAETLRPDRVVTLIDAEWKIRARLETHYGERAFQLIAQAPDLDLERILRWLGSEVSTSEDWAEWCSVLNGKRVDHVVMGVAAPAKVDRSKFIPDVDNLVKAATEQRLPKFYASYSMTVAGQAERKIINEAVWHLREHGLVIDPGTIELEAGPQQHDEDVIVFAYTVFRDLRWNVKKVDAVAAFHPYSDQPPPLSTGMMDELGHARAYGKDIYLVLPTGGGSPFTAGNFVPRNHVFSTAEALFEFLEKKRRPQLPARFASQVAAFDRFASDHA